MESETPNENKLEKIVLYIKNKYMHAFFPNWVLAEFII